MASSLNEAFVVWITPLFEIATGVVVGLSLVPLRRHADATEELLTKATIGCVLAALFVFVLASCIIHDASPIDFIAATSIGSRPSVLPRSGVGFVIGMIIFITSGVAAWFAAQKTLDVSRDETLDRW